jgi:hypothetical protein
MPKKTSPRNQYEQSEIFLKEVNGLSKLGRLDIQNCIEKLEYTLTYIRNKSPNVDR